MVTKTESKKALTADKYDEQWSVLADFVKYNPGVRHRNRLILKLLHDVNFETCVDVGCGRGALLSLLRKIKENAELTGVDFSTETVAKNITRIPGLTFEVLDIQKGALDEQFDLVVCSEVLEHLERRGPAFSNLERMVKSGGHLLITVPAGKIFETERFFGHVSHPGEKEITSLAQANNLEILKMWKWGWPVYYLLKYVTNINSKWSLKNFGSGYYSPMSKFIANMLFYLNYLNINSRFGCQFFVLMKKSG
ncbi:MAG: methyltransferase domain-containing protein [Nitrospiraceae bacterium]|nr:methyltransferase domain-containing protein [Nitrospiraceae bacterium]